MSIATGGGYGYVCYYLLSLIKRSTLICFCDSTYDKPFIAIYMLSSFSVVTGYIGVLTNSVDIERGYIKIIMKITGLSIATQFVSDICRDNGFSAVASQLELLCRVSIVLISMPVIIALLEMVNGCLK